MATSLDGSSQALSQGIPAPPGGVTQLRPLTTYSNGILSASPLSTLLEEDRRKAQRTQSEPLMGSLANYVRMQWMYARDAKRQTVETRLLKNVRARRGDYEPEKLAAIRDEGGSEVFAMLTSTKCRSAGSWIRDVLMGQGSEKPWTLTPSKVPELPQATIDDIVSQAVEPLQQAIEAGMPMSQGQAVQLLSGLRDAALEQVRDQARSMAHRMENKMEDQLNDGGWLQAIDAFIDDITTFPAAVIKGPIVKNKPVLTWSQDAQGQSTPKVETKLTLEFERIDPFLIYPSPAASTIDDGYLIEKHRMSRQQLLELIGVEGYDDSSIRLCLEEFGTEGLREWLTNDTAQADAEGKSTTSITQNPDKLIDALQFWGSVNGKMLIEWGMDKHDVPDPTKEYHCEIWLINRYVIKAQMNYDPLHRKPYYKTSYEEIPGAWWGNSVADLVRNSQTVVNAAARAIVNNMGIASGPQVVLNVNRLPDGVDITQMRPWQIWQVKSDPLGGNAPAIEFHQPDSRVAELMQVFEQWSALADEYSGIPRFMGGDASGNAGRTASGLSILMSNAGKSIKQVISNIDVSIFNPMLERLYYYNMRYGTDPDLKGDVNIVARGANSLIAKDAAQMRRNEFLQQTANPIDMQIIGMAGRAALLREQVKTLDMDVDKIVPSPDVMAARQAVAAFSQAHQMAANQVMGTPGSPPPQPGAAPPGVPGQPGMGGGPGMPGQTPQGSPPNPVVNQQTLTNGAPVTDTFAPTS
jgi:hypothetical protein